MATKKTSAKKSVGTAKKAARKQTVTAYETRPAKKLSLEKLQRLESGVVNQMHNRFIVDRKNKVAWVPAWVEKLKSAKE